MGRRKSFVAVLWIGLAGVAVGQTPPSASMLSQISRSGHLQFSLTSGRVITTGRQFGGMSSSASSSGGSSEKLSVQNNAGEPTLSYERSSAQEELSLQITSGDRLAIHRQGKADSGIVPLEFSQVPNEPLLLRLGPADQAQVFRAAGLWHLAIGQPEEWRKHLVPLLELLRPEWKLAEAAAALETELLRLAAAGEQPSYQQWSALVEQLGDNQFTKREAADRQLRAAGPAVLGFLRQLDRNRLDAEQQFRVRRIIAAISGPNIDDTADRVAPALMHDPTIWLALLSRAEESTRRTAAKQLAVILGKPVAFDPAADAPTRKNQIEQIRQQIPAKAPKGQG